MPAGDRTGPNGQGAMTGRGAGACAGNNMTNGAGFGRGFGRGMGRGQGFGFRAAAPTREQQVSSLKQQSEAIQQQINSLEAE